MFAGVPTGAPFLFPAAATTLIPVLARAVDLLLQRLRLAPASSANSEENGRTTILMP